MLRTLALTSLVVLNLVVWLGPADHLKNRFADNDRSTVSLDDAIRLANDGKIEAALQAYQALLDAYPHNAAYHYNYGLFCGVHAEALVALGWRKDEIANTMRRHMYLARELNPEDESIACDYARILMDESFFEPVATRSIMIESWEYIIALADARLQQEPDWYYHRDLVGGALLNLARIEFRCGEVDGARRYLKDARAILPAIRIPEQLLACLQPVRSSHS